MSTFESRYESLLQGVSQQIPDERLPGQVETQINMVSDPVTNVRRRPGTQYTIGWEWEGATADNLIGWFVDIAGYRVHILLNAATSMIRVYDEQFVLLAELNAGDYLISDDITRIRAASVGSEFFLANTSAIPVIDYTPTNTDPNNSGFFYIVSGAFSKEYNVSIINPDGDTTATYTTPNGTGGTDAYQSTPEYIAEQLANQLSAGTFTQVRINSFTAQWYRGNGWLNPGTYNYGYGISINVRAIFQINDGTPTAPIWTTLALPADVPLDAFVQNRIRVLWTYSSNEYARPSVPTRARINYAVYSLGAWSTDTWWSAYATSTFAGGTSVSQGVVIPLTHLTGGVPENPGEESSNPLFVDRDGPYVFISQVGGISVQSNVGTGYMIVSKGSILANEGQLPSRLPASADGYVVRVGTGNTPQYYRYQHSTTEWIEVAQYGSPANINNVPVSVTYTSDYSRPILDENGDPVTNGLGEPLYEDSWQLNNSPFEGRFAGDDESNETHEWMLNGISGMSTYQGRLVLMSGPLVSLSASNRPRRFFRSTVSEILNNDPIEVGSSLNSAAAYEHAVPFQKDLILFSRAYQAVIPFTNTAITPNNAVVVPTSTFEVDTTSAPITVGRTLLFCKPQSEDFNGVMEMVPSNFTDSQYVSQDSTPHLPRYIAGRCRFAVSSSVSNMALFGLSTDKRTIVVHEYHWDGEEKVQQSWHKWTFMYDVATAYFASDKIVILFAENEFCLVTVLDPRRGIELTEGTQRTFLDYNFTTQIRNHIITVPEWLLQFAPSAMEDLVVMASSGSDTGSLVGIEERGSNWLRTVASRPSGTVTVGIPYRSEFTPTPPDIKDYLERTVHTGKATLLRYMVRTHNTSKYWAQVQDRYTAQEPLAVSPISWYDPELQLGATIRAEEHSDIIPCRTDLRTSYLTLWTDGVGEMNITSIEYIGKHNQRLRRGL